MKTQFMMPERMKYSCWDCSNHVWSFMNITAQLLFSTKGKVLSHSTEFITFQSGTSAASLPFLSSCWLFRRNDAMAESSPPFPGPLGTASRSNKSFPFISGSILTGCRWEANMSTSILTAAGADGTLFPPPRLFYSLPEANVAWQEHAMNVNRGMCSGNDRCTPHVD